MVQYETSTTSTRAARRSPQLRHTLARLAVACSITIGVLAVAGPSWAGPIMGC